MVSTRLKMRGTPEAAGYGFVLGVGGGALLGDSLSFVAMSALCGAVIVPLLQRVVRLRVPILWAAKIHTTGRAADIRPS